MTHIYYYRMSKPTANKKTKSTDTKPVDVKETDPKKTVKTGVSAVVATDKSKKANNNKSKRR